MGWPQTNALSCTNSPVTPTWHIHTGSRKKVAVSASTVSRAWTRYQEKVCYAIVWFKSSLDVLGGVDWWSIKPAKSAKAVNLQDGQLNMELRLLIKLKRAAQSGNNSLLDLDNMCYLSHTWSFLIHTTYIIIKISNIAFEKQLPCRTLQRPSSTKNKHCFQSAGIIGQWNKYLLASAQV